MFGEQAYCLFVEDLVGGIEIEFIFDGFVQTLLEGETVGIDSVAVFLGEYKVEADESLEFLGEVYAFGEAEDGEECLVDFVFLWIFFEEDGFEGLFEEALHWVGGGVLRL